ncbi:hypothetical protein [Kaistella rhinocerotis]|uniref:hypothetical protein n=1 Tax=Kaistella rhinocerotis TaxID=3026437 RepID=UPI002555F0F8|nr:hypothetical protein [Kaistella sp. Ran72]
MKKFALFVSLVFSVMLLAQKTHQFKDHQFPARYVLKKSTDTVQSHIQNMGAFKLSTYSPATVIKKLYMIDDFGKKFNLKENDVAYIEFTDTEDLKHVFVAAPDHLDLGLVKSLHKGRMSYFIDYYFTNLYGNYSSTEYLVEDNKELIKSGLFNASGKKLKERFADYPDLLTLVDTMKTREDLVNILKLYDQK